MEKVSGQILWPVKFTNYYLTLTGCHYREKLLSNPFLRHTLVFNSVWVKQTEKNNCAFNKCLCQCQPYPKWQPITVRQLVNSDEPAFWPGISYQGCTPFLSVFIYLLNEMKNGCISTCEVSAKKPSLRLNLSVK